MKYPYNCHEFIPSSRRITKVTRHVRFGERLDLGPYCAYGEASFEEEEEDWW